MMYIHPDECVDCGACEPVCPVQAISYEDDLPAEQTVFIESARQFFVGLGSPGGAAKHGKIDGDSELVSGVPARDHRDPGA
jgi:ferredoxin